MVKNYDSFHFNIRLCIGADNRNKIFQKMLHKGVAMFEVIQDFDVGDLIDFKSVITNRNGQNDLGKIFHIRL